MFYVFGSRVAEIDFDWFDFEKLILAKSLFKVKSFVFRYVQEKVSWNKFECKIHVWSQMLQTCKF